jgi:hypothetical protein
MLNSKIKETLKIIPEIAESKPLAGNNVHSLAGQLCVQWTADHIDEPVSLVLGKSANVLVSICRTINVVKCPRSLATCLLGFPHFT